MFTGISFKQSDILKHRKKQIQSFEGNIEFNTEQTYTFILYYSGIFKRRKLGGVLQIGYFSLVIKKLEIHFL